MAAFVLTGTASGDDVDDGDGLDDDDDEVMECEEAPVMEADVVGCVAASARRSSTLRRFRACSCSASRWRSRSSSTSWRDSLWAALRRASLVSSRAVAWRSCRISSACISTTCDITLIRPTRLSTVIFPDPPPPAPPVSDLVAPAADAGVVAVDVAFGVDTLVCGVRGSG
jgi:hypothetical protein